MIKNLCVLLLAAWVVTGFPAIAAEPIRWAELSQRPAPAAGAIHAYGTLADQHGELRLPSGSGPFPVAVLLHGGCWLEDYDLAYFRHLAEAVTKLGWASWTVEYRRVGGAGGWPETFLDVADALDYLTVLGQAQPLDLTNTIVVGHSAGAQLALWAAQRDRIAEGHPLYRPQPLAVWHVLALSPVLDLARYRIGPQNSCHGAVEPLMGGTPDTVPDRYASVSPIELLPVSVPVSLISGRDDPTVSAASVRRYFEHADSSRVSLALIDGAEHFDPAVPGSMAWPRVRARLLSLLPPAKKPGKNR